MSLRMTIKQFEELNLFSNRNIEKVIASVVNESSNAALVSTFEDSVILLDHEEGQFYTADYTFDGKKLKLTLENFQPIDLEKEENDFKDHVSKFFESDEHSAIALTESYKNSVLEQEKFINELISEALSMKSFEENISYKELAEANDDISIADKPYFKAYKERLETNPLTEVKFFNWKDKVVVSLLESEKVKLINSSALEKAAELWKKESFKKSFNEAASLFIEDVEAGKEKFANLLEEYPQIFLLDSADRKTMFGKAIIANSALREHLEDLQEGINILFEDDDIKSIKESYLSLINESDDDEEEKIDDERSKEDEIEDGEEEDGEEEDDGEEESPAKELNDEEIEEIANEIKKISDKIEDENLKEKLKELAEKLEKSIEEGTRPDLIKEAVYLLSI